MKYTIGIDFGTLSARAVILDATGVIMGDCTVEYPHGVMDKALPDGTPLAQDYAFQHPDDYLFALKSSISGALDTASLKPADISAICIDFTSCTLVAHKADGTPICNISGFESDPHAYVKLWKHHAAQPQADQINALATQRKEPWLSMYGGKICR